MTAQTQTYYLFGGIGAVLVFATVVGWVLRLTVARGQPHAVIDNLISRVNAWWVMVALVGGAFLLGKGGVIFLFGLASFFALREFITLAPTHRGDHQALWLAFFVFLPCQYFLVWIEWYGLFAILIPVYAFLCLPIVAALSGQGKDFLQRTATVQWGLMICVYCISHVPALLTLEIPGYAGSPLSLLFYLVMVVQLSDVFQYVWGKTLGKHPIAPTVSPSKTWEGFVGGILTASGLGAALWWATPFLWWQSGLVSLGICFMGFAGGLVMSAIKRDRGVKDYGALIEGHGGVLDRIDSICFAAPVFFHIVRYYWT